MPSLLTLLRMEWRLARRGQQKLATGVLFVLTASFVMYLGVRATQGAVPLSSLQWNLLFWLVFLFTSLYVGGGLADMRSGRVLFYFLLATPLKIWFARVLHTCVWLLLLGGIALCLQLLWMGNPLLLWGRFIGILVLASLGFSTLITTLSLMVARLEAPGRLFALLSFPPLCPLYLFSLHASQSCLVQAPVGLSGIWSLFGFVLLLISLCWLLFPYIWRG